MSEVEVTKIIQSLHTKSCKLDAMPTEMIKKNLEHFVKVITKFVNYLWELGCLQKNGN